MAGFIPKEDLPTYQRWQVGSFDAQPSPASVTSPVQSSSEKEEHRAPQFHLPTAEEIERLHEDARAEGYRAGYAEGQNAAAEAAEAARADESARFLMLMQNFSDALTAMDQEIAEQVLDLALEVSRQVIRSTIDTQREALLPIVREAIAALPLHHAHVSLHLNPADAAMVKENIGEQLAQSGTQILDDPAISPGGCKLVAGASEIDASIETRWKRVLEAIGATPTEWLRGNK